MAFNVTAKFGNPVATVKDHETVQVQAVQVSNKLGHTWNRIEARIFVDNPDTGYKGPTKVALVFDDADDLSDMVDALQQALAQVQAGNGLGTVNAAPVKPRKKSKAAHKAA